MLNNEVSDKPYALMNGAMGEVDATIRDVDAQRRIAADDTQPLPMRLEAYEDIIDSQVGDTTMVRARNIEREMGLRQIFLKLGILARNPEKSGRSDNTI